MKLSVYSVFDCKAAVFAHPAFLPNDAVAVRAFKDAVNRPGSEMSAHSADYSFYRIGTFDDAVGRLEAEPQPVALVTAAAVLVAPKEA